MANPVLRAQENLARTIQGGLSGLGDRPLNQAKFNLFEKQTMADIARKQAADEMSKKRMGLLESAERRAIDAEKRATELQKHNIQLANSRESREADRAAREAAVFEFQKPQYRLSRDQAIMQADQLSRTRQLGEVPLTPASFVNFVAGSSRENVSDALSNDYLWNALKTFGGSVIETPQGQRIVGPKGRQLKFKDLQVVWPQVRPIVESSRDPVLYAKQKVRQLEKLGTDGLPPEEYEQYLTLKKNSNDPAWQIEQLEKAQNADLVRAQQYAERGYPTKPFEFNIQKRASKIASIQNSLATQSERKFKKELEETKQGGKIDPKIKGAQDLYKHLTKKTSESAGAVLAKMIAGQQTSAGDVQSVKEELNPSDQKLLDRMVEILNEHYGVKNEPQIIESEITHDFVPGQGLVQRTK